jgi:hypothetical protein
MPGLADKIKLLMDWWPVVALLQRVAALPPGRAQAAAVVDLLRFLATKTEVEFDDHLAEKVQKVVETPAGGELVDYVVSITRPSGV